MQYLGGVLAILSLFLLLGRFFASSQANKARKAGLESYRLRDWETLRTGLTYGAIASFVIGLGLLATTAVFTVPANHVGIEVLFGKPTRTYTEGLHIKNPLSDIHLLSGLQQETTYSATVGEGEKGGPDAVEAITSDNAVVDVDASLLWYLDLGSESAINIYREYRTIDQIRLRLLRTVSRDVIRDCLARVAFEEARTTERQNIADCAHAEIQTQVEGNGVIIRAVQIRNMSARSGQLQEGIDRKLIAEQSAREAEFRRTQAKVDAETARIQAEGLANADIARAEGVAQANDLINASLTGPLLEYRKYELLSQSNNTVWVLGGNGTGNTDSPQLVIPMTALTPAETGGGQIGLTHTTTQP